MRILLLLLVLLSGCSEGLTMEKSDLARYVTEQNGTEPPFDNEYYAHTEVGIYVDVNTGEPLFTSEHKYDSGSGWPAFTDAIPGSSIEIKQDRSQGMVRNEVRTEESHLGHVFDDGPQGKPRYCINSAALNFIPYESLDEKGYGEYKSLFPFKQAVFGGGCFWGVEHLFSKQNGVVAAVSGYMGGTRSTAKYDVISLGVTDHAEVVQVTFDPRIVSYRELTDLFWRMHDPTQLDRQGPDVGKQYRSVIFTYGDEQENIALQSKSDFDKKKIFKNSAVTVIEPAKEFFAAEEYHQDYVVNNPNYVCHELRVE